MVQTEQTARTNDPTPISSPTASPRSMLPRLHTDFVEVQVHTAKCDLCEKNNKLTLFRCTECGQHVCSMCWNKQSGDGTHVSNGGLAGAAGSNADHMVDDDETGDKRDDESQRRTRAGRRVRVISDDEDDDLPVLKPAPPTTENAEVKGASKQHGKRNKVTMNADPHEDHEHGLSKLWPIASARRLPEMMPAVQVANTNANKGANRVTQRNSHIQGQGQKSEIDQQRMAQSYDGLARQAAPTRDVFVDGQQIIRQARHQILPSGSHHQATRPTPLHAQPAVYRPRPGADLDQQAARNQYAFANNQPTNRQAPRPAQPLTAQQQATQLAPRHIKPAVYRPRPGANVDQQAARNQFAFANPPHTTHHASRPPQASISQQHAQNATHMAQIAARNQKAFRLNQQASAYANAEQTEVRTRQVSISHQNPWLAANGGQVATHNQQALNLDRLSPAAANHVVQMLAARDRQEAYLARQQANHPRPGPAQTSASHGSPSPLPAQPILPPQHAAPLASRHVQHRMAIQDILNEPAGAVRVQVRSPEVLEAVDVLLSYAEVEQVPGVRSPLNQNGNGVLQLLSAADQLDETKPARSVSRSSSKTLVGGSEAAGTGAQSVSPHGPALSPVPRTTDADSAKARVDKHRVRLDGLHSSSGTPSTVSDLPVSPRGHPSYGHAASSQPDSGPALADTSAAQSHGSSPPGAQSPRLPMSDHAATYLNQWNSGRAALSSSSRSSAADVTPTQLRFPVPALHPRSTSRVQETVARGTKEGKAAEVSTPPLSAPMSVTEGSTDVDVEMGSPDVEILEEEESRRYKAWAVNHNPWTMGMAKGAEKARARAPEPIPGLRSDGRGGKHQRGEKKGDRKMSKEQKASGDVDVVDARGRNNKGNHSGQIDDDGSDIEITSWKDVHGNKTTGKHRGTKAGAKGPEVSRTLKKGVAQVKKQERKGRKGRTTAT